jgi:cytoskeletal protein CcmA (bactofilin family)
MSDYYSRDVDERELDTVLAEDFTFEGELQFSDSLMIKGPFRGDIRATGDLYIGEKAVVEARIEAVVVRVRGRVVGNIVAKRRIELSSGAQVEGDITAPEVVMEAGAKLNGICTMPLGDAS